ncbi:MAG: DUF3341 domain-containing protein [Planctomycetota bacterium]|jgi:hypothetical protein
MSDTTYYGVVAEFETAADIYHAAEKVTQAGYHRVDAHTPFPVHGIDKALKQGDSHVGWICAFLGLAGILLGQLMMWWMNGYDYPFIVAGKRPYDWPPTIPITFECMVLLAAFGALIGMLTLNKLPRLHHPVFNHSTFHRAGDDRFFLSVEAVDPKFDRVETVKFLESLGGQHVELVED